MGMYLLIRHELNEETKAKRDEVAEAKARNRQRVAQPQLRQTSKEPSHTTGTLSNTQAKARAKDKTRVGNTLANGYMRANGAIGIILREYGKAKGLPCQGALLVSACTGK
jgi:predicted transcriptional regulator